MNGYAYDLSHILIFKTNIRSAADKLRVAPSLGSAQVVEWSVDCEDVDCVLRVVSAGATNDHVISLVRSAGYECEILE